MISAALLLLSQSLFFSLHLAGNPGSFPQPLSAQEEQECLDRWSRGDLEARNRLVEHNLRLVAHIIKKYYTQADNQDDLISIGTIGLIKAINTFCSDKNIKLATYASRCIENEILMYIRKVSNRRFEMSIDEPLNTDWDGNELLLSDVLGGDEDAVYQNMEYDEDRRTIEAAVSKLSPREQTIIRLRFGLGGGKEKTQKEVADQLGISQSYISRLEKKIIERLREEIETKI